MKSISSCFFFFFSFAHFIILLFLSFPIFSFSLLILKLERITYTSSNDSRKSALSLSLPPPSPSQMATSLLLSGFLLQGAVKSLSSFPHLKSCSLSFSSIISKASKTSNSFSPSFDSLSANLQYKFLLASF